MHAITTSAAAGVSNQTSDNNNYDVLRPVLTAPVRRACDGCHRRKVKCDGRKPCFNCRHSALLCTFNAVPQKKGPKGQRARVLSELRRDQQQRATALAAAANHHSTGRPTVRPLEGGGSRSNSDDDVGGSQAGSSTAASPPPPLLAWSSTPPWAPTPGLLTPRIVDGCIDFFFAHMYPTMPVLGRDAMRRQAREMDRSVEAYCLVGALCAFMLIQPGMSVVSGCSKTAAAPGRREQARRGKRGRRGGEGRGERGTGEGEGGGGGGGGGGGDGSGGSEGIYDMDACGSGSGDGGGSTGVVESEEEEIVLEDGVAAGRRMVDEVLRVRKGYDYVECPSTATAITSFFLFGSYFGLDRHNAAWYYLREATTLVQILRMNDESSYAYDYTTDDDAVLDSILRRRFYWLLFVTER
jgi:hypothetical protein